MKKVNKLVSLVLALAMCLAITIPASATQATYDAGNGITVRTGGDMPVMPRIYSYWDTCTSNTYFNSFTIYAVNGNRMTLTFENSSSSTVVVNLTIAGSNIPSMTLPGNSSDYFELSGDPELACNVDIRMYTTTGANMNVLIKGWQYQVN